MFTRTLAAALPYHVVSHARFRFFYTARTGYREVLSFLIARLLCGCIHLPPLPSDLLSSTSRSEAEGQRRAERDDNSQCLLSSVAPTERIARDWKRFGLGGSNPLLAIVPFPHELFHCRLLTSGLEGLLAFNHSNSMVKALRFSFAHST